MSKPEVCPTCQTGHLSPTNVKGRTFPYKDLSELILAHDMTVYACDNAACGDMMLSGEDCRKLDVYLKPIYEAMKAEGRA